MIVQMMYYGGIVVSVVLFLLLLLLFIRNKIFRIICDLCGLTAKKRMRENKENKAGNKKAIFVRSGDTTERLEVSEETTVLTREQQESNSTFRIVEDIVIVHSKETI